MISNETDLKIQLLSQQDVDSSDSYVYDFDEKIYALNKQIELLSSKADSLDYLVSISSGILCGILDILWVGEFDLKRGRDIASSDVDNFVVKTARLLGCKSDDLTEAVKFLEKKFPIPSDGNTPVFGGGLQHHLRDFAHHPTIVGLMFSLLTQFTSKSYGTDTLGKFIIVDVPEKSKIFIGKDPAQKIINGTVIWFFHLVSDMAGSGSTAGRSGGTGIPGPLLSLAKELSALPLFRDMKIHGESVSKLISKLFNGTLFAKLDANKNIIPDTVIKFDLRGEMGAQIELAQQAVPVIANESIVRTFYFIRRLALEIQENDIRAMSQMQSLDWNKVKPAKSPTLDRMLTISTGVFTTLDVADAIASQKYFVAVNYVGIGRFAVALEHETVWALKRRDVKKIRQMYETIRRFAYSPVDQNIYERIQDTMDIEKFGLTEQQTEILYNVEYYKTLNDINHTSGDTKALKTSWLKEWQRYMTTGYAEFLQSENAELHWHEWVDLLMLIKENDPSGVWFRLVLLEAMLFEPYYPLATEKDKKGREVPSKKYEKLKGTYRKGHGDDYLEEQFARNLCSKSYIRRYRECYRKVMRELQEVQKAHMKALAVGAGVVVLVIASVGAFVPEIAVLLVGSNFAGLHGAALINACLAYLGGGAISAGGLGMAGGTMTIVGGGAILGLGAGAGAGGIVVQASLHGKEDTILQSAKLLVAVREIFLNDEHDVAYSDSVYEQYVNNCAKLEKVLIDLKVGENNAADPEEKERIKSEIKKTEEIVHAMKLAIKSMKRFISSFKTGL